MRYQICNSSSDDGLHPQGGYLFFGDLINVFINAVAIFYHNYTAYVLGSRPVFCHTATSSNVTRSSADHRHLTGTE